MSFMSLLGRNFTGGTSGSPTFKIFLELFTKVAYLLLIKKILVI